MTLLAYQLSITDITAHLVAVELRFTPQSSDSIQLSLPSWIPGSYMVRDFAKHLHSIEAFDDAGALTLQQLDKQSWQLNHIGNCRCSRCGDCSHRQLNWSESIDQFSFWLLARIIKIFV